METLPNTAALYLRKSSLDERSGDNRSISEQRHECLAVAEREGLTIVKTFEERVGTSASRFSKQPRPKWDQAVREMGNTYNVLITQAVDRTTRRGITETGDLLKAMEAAGGRLISLDDGIDSDLMNFADRLRYIMSGELAREESERIGTRSRRGKDEARRRVEYQGGVCPFGLLRDHDTPHGVVVDPVAAKAITHVVEMIERGASLGEATNWLNSNGHRTALDREWKRAGLGDFLRSPHLIGQRTCQGDVHRGEDGSPILVCDPILDEATWRRVDKTLRDRVTRANPSNGEPGGNRGSSLLLRLATCGDCGNSLHGASNNKGATYYRCSKCVRPQHSVRKGAVDEFVSRQALAFLSALEPNSPIMEEVGRRWLDRFSPEQQGRHNEIRDELDIVEGRQRALQSEFYEAGTMDADNYARFNRKLAGRISTLRDELREAPVPQADLTALMDLTASADDPEGDPVGPGSCWAALPIYEQRQILAVLIDSVVVERRCNASADIEGRTVITFATRSNVIDLATRFDNDPRPVGVAKTA